MRPIECAFCSTRSQFGYSGKVYLRPGDVVEVVRENVDGHVGHNFCDLTVSVPSTTHLVNVVICHMASFLHNATSEDECCTSFVVGDLSASGVKRLLL